MFCKIKAKEWLFISPKCDMFCSSQLISKSMATDAAASKLRSQFLNVLLSRRPSQVPISVVPGKHVKDPLFEESPKPNFSEAMASCPKEDIPNFKELLQEENFYLNTEVWDRIAPGLASQFDAPYTVPTMAPRPLLISNGEDDPRCPLGGLEIPESRARKAYEEANCPQNFKLIAQPGIGHQMTTLMVKEASDWFDRFLKV